MASKRITIPHHRRRGRDRRALMMHLLDKTGCRVEIRKLRETHWKPLLRSYADLPLDAIPYESLMQARYGPHPEVVPGTSLRPGASPGPGTSPGQNSVIYHNLASHPGFLAYLNAIEDFTAHRLRLTWRGHPPSWALRDVHDRVLERADWSIDGPDNRDFWEDTPIEPRLRVTLEIEVTPAGARVRGIDANTDELLSAREIPAPSAYVAFDHDNWQDLEREAIAALTQEAIPHMRTAWDDHYRSMRRNLVSQQNELDDLAKLATWYYMDIKPDDRTKKRLQHLAKMLVVDLPTARKQG